jgi:hypothetical protein
VLLTPLILSHFKKEVERDFQSNYSMCKTSAVHTDATNMNKIYWENNTSAVASILFAKLSDAECVFQSCSTCIVCLVESYTAVSIQVQNGCNEKC